MSQLQSRITKLFYCSILLSVAIIFFASHSNDKQVSHMEEEKLNQLTTPWSTSEPSIGTLPATFQTIKYESVLLYHNLPFEYAFGSSLSFYTKNQKVEVYLNNDLIYSYGNDGMQLIESSQHWHFVSIPDRQDNKKLTIRLESTINGKVNIPDVVLGNKYAVIFKIMRNNLIPFAMVAFLLALGFVSLLFYSLARNAKRQHLLYLGILAIIYGTYSLTETPLLQLLVSNQETVATLGNACYLLLPIAFLHFFIQLQHGANQKVIIRLQIALLCNFVFFFLFQFILQLDCRYFLRVFYLLNGITFGYIGYYFYSRICKQHLQNLSIYAMAFGILIATILFDFFYSSMTFRYDNTQLTRFGMILFVIILALDQAKNDVTIAQLLDENRNLGVMAFKDPLTGLGNRASFKRQMEAYYQREHEYDSIILVFFDVDRLKEINDRFGHIAGDDALIRCATLLYEIFHDTYPCHRIGGDEFAMIVANKNIAFVNTCIDALVAFIDKENEQVEYNLSISYGYEEYQARIDDDIYSVLERADQNMYVRKTTKQRLGEWIHQKD